MDNTETGNNVEENEVTIIMFSINSEDETSAAPA
jgi:hypothetical protein